MMQSQVMHPELTPAPEANERVEALVREAARHAVACVWPRPEAVVLTGSIARGEGSVLVSRGHLMRMLSDVEFMVVFPPDADLVPLQRALNREARALSRELAARRIECEVEFSAVNRRYFRTLRPHIFGYELLSHGCTVWGNPDILGSAPRFAASQIPHWDAWRLLNNRLLEQLLEVEAIESADRSVLIRVFYSLVKLHLDLGTALLVFAGRYEDTYAGRVRALLRWASELAEPVPAPFIEDLAERVTDCTAFKLAPNELERPLGVHLDTEDTEALRRDVRDAVLGFIPLAHSIWRWGAAKFANRSIGPLIDDSRLSDAVLRSQGLAEKLRGWAKLVLMPEVRQQPGFGARMLKLLHRASPRYLIYRVASGLYSQMPDVLAGGQPGEEAAALEQFLPVTFAEYEHEGRTWWRLRANVLRGWRLFLRNHWA